VAVTRVATRQRVEAIFDTNILIDYLVGRDDARVEFERYTRRGISIVTWMELQIGARSDAEADVIDLFLREFTVLELTRRVAREAIATRRRTKVRLPDAVIWATAQSEEAVLVTRNTKDFPPDAPGVRVPY
jgi:predicted nucleic acid-binding protein